METFCRQILCRGDLASKLAPAKISPAFFRQNDRQNDRQNGWQDGQEYGQAAVHIDMPARDAGLELRSGAGPLPRPHALAAPAARAACLAKFAHHELMAVELFAWALLRWPELPRAMQRGMLQILSEEQEHCRLYLERLATLEGRIEDHELSNYFWKHAPAIAASPAGPRAFLSAMGLTLEQGNLDFAPLYRDAFLDAGDPASARVCERVHRDEIGHVRFAAHWLRVLSSDDDDEISRYEQTVPFPLSAARAKGRRFNAEARREAGLSETFIEHVRTAGPKQDRRDRPRA